MAKKKSSAAATVGGAEQKQEKARIQDGRPAAEDEAAEKVRNLKALNAVLVKQAHELRVERSSVMRVNEELKAMNERLEMEKCEAEENEMRLGLEKEVEAVVVGRGVVEMRRCGLELVEVMRGMERKVEVLGREVGELWSENESMKRALKEMGEYSLDVEKERDGLKVEVEARNGEVSALKVKVDEVTARESVIVEVLRIMKKDYEAAVRARMEREAEIEVLKDEKDSINMSLEQSLAYSESLKDEIGSLSREKHFVVMERDEKMMVIDRLEKEMSGLRESVLVLQAEVERLKEGVLEFEKCNTELMQQRGGLLMELEVLKSQSKESEERIGNLLSEKDMLTHAVEKSASDLTQSVKEAEKVKALMQDVISESLEAHKTELDEMQEMVCHLQNKLELTQKSYGTEVEENKKLVSDLARLGNELESVNAEKACAQKEIQLEKKNMKSLTNKIVELENSVQESGKEIQRLENEMSKLKEAKKTVEGHLELLKKETGLVRKKLEGAEERINKERTNSESASVMSDIVLGMLKKTASQLHESVDLLGEVEQLPTFQSDEMKPFVSEMEAIKNVFRSREATIADMRKQLEMMKHLVAEAEKGRSIWKLVSSATIIFAVASLAYVSNRHRGV